jgi:hypothetical protein
MKRFEEIGDSFLFLIKNYPENEKKKIRKELENFKFTSRKREDPLHPNNIRENCCSSPLTSAEAILNIMQPYYNANTANNVKEYIIKNL